MSDPKMNQNNNDDTQADEIIVPDPEISSEPRHDVDNEPVIGAPDEAKPSEYKLQDPVASPKPSSSGRGAAYLAMLLSLGAIAGVAWQYQQKQVPVKNTETDQLITQLSTRIDGLQKKLDDAQQHNAALLAKSAEGTGRLNQSVVELKGKNVEGDATIASLQDVVSRLALQQMGSTRSSQLEEVEYLLRFASQRAQLFHDLDGAIQALKQADGLLQLINIPDFQPVRTRISTELALLRGVDLPDMLSISSTLNAYQNQLAQWPFATQEKSGLDDSADETISTDTGWWQKTRQAVGGLVTVRRTGDQPTVLRKPEAQELLQENLRLKLEAARMALMSTNQELYAQNIGLVVNWLESYYDVNDSRVLAAVEKLNTLSEIELLPSFGDVSGALQVYLATRTQLTLEDDS